MSKPSYTVYTKDFANMVCRRLERENKKKDKEIERLNNIINELEYLIESAYNWEGVSFQVKVNGKWTITEDMEEVRKYIKELKGSDKE